MLPNGWHREIQLWPRPGITAVLNDMSQGQQLLNAQITGPVGTALWRWPCSLGSFICDLLMVVSDDLLLLMTASPTMPPSLPLSSSPARRSWKRLSRRSSGTCSSVVVPAHRQHVHGSALHFVRQGCDARRQLDRRRDDGLCVRHFCDRMRYFQIPPGWFSDRAGPRRALTDRGRRLEYFYGEDRCGDDRDRLAGGSFFVWGW